MKKGLIFLFLVLLISGCAPKVERVGKKIYEKDVKKIVLGVTNKDDLIALFGQPSKVRVFEDGSQQWVYEYREKRSPSYFGGLIVDEKRAKETIHTLRVTLNKEGKVVSYHFKKKEEE